MPFELSSNREFASIQVGVELARQSFHMALVEDLIVGVPMGGQDRATTWGSKLIFLLTTTNLHSKPC